MNVLHLISLFPETIEPKALLSFLNALSSSITLKANSAETTLRRSRRRKSHPKKPCGGLYSKVLLDGSFSPDHTHIALKGAPQAKFGAGGHIELESDITIEKDPRLNTHTLWRIQNL